MAVESNPETKVRLKGGKPDRCQEEGHVVTVRNEAVSRSGRGEFSRTSLWELRQPQAFLSYCSVLSCSDKLKRCSKHPEKLRMVSQVLPAWCNSSTSKVSPLSSDKLKETGWSSSISLLFPCFDAFQSVILHRFGFSWFGLSWEETLFRAVELNLKRKEDFLRMQRTAMWGA